MQPGDISSDPPVVELSGHFVQLVVLWHGSNDAFSEPGGKGFHRLTLHCRLGVDVENVGSTAQTVAFGEAGDCAVVQELDPFDGTVDAVAVADGEIGKTFVLFIPGGYLLPGLFLKALQSLVKVSNGFRVLLLFLVVNPVLLPDGVNEGLSEVAESDWVVDIEPLNDVSSRCQ